MWEAIAIQAAFNVLNAYFDAYRILKNKTIAHWLNFGCYAILYGVEVWQFHYSLPQALLLASIALINRQLTFDIPLNLRRRIHNKVITWDYVTAAENPAWWDSIEIKIFGRNGKKTVAWYVGIFICLTGISFLCR